MAVLAQHEMRIRILELETRTIRAHQNRKRAMITGAPPVIANKYEVMTNLRWLVQKAGLNFEYDVSDYYSHQVNEAESVVFIDFHTTDNKNHFVKTMRNYQQKALPFWHVKAKKEEAKDLDRPVKVANVDDVYSKLEKSPLYAAMQCIFEHSRDVKNALEAPLSPVEQTLQCWMRDTLLVQVSYVFDIGAKGFYDCVIDVADEWVEVVQNALPEVWKRTMKKHVQLAQAELMATSLGSTRRSSSLELQRDVTQDQDPTKYFPWNISIPVSYTHLTLPTKA